MIVTEKTLAVAGLAYSLHGAAGDVVMAVAAGSDFSAACEDENLYGDRADIVAERALAAETLRRLGFQF
jgi:hypothetical protein